MSYFYYTINKDYSISDNIGLDASDNWNKLRRITSTTEIYSIHVLSGYCLLDINGHRVELREKDLLVLMKGCFIHTVEHSDDLKYYCLVAKGRIIRDMFDEVGFNLATPERMNKYYQTACSDKHHAVQLEAYLSLKRRIASGTSFDRCMVLRIIEILFLKDMEEYWRLRPEALLVPTRKEQIFYDFMKLVEIHFREERNLAFYASALGLTSKYLSAVIKEVSGCQFTYWIDEPLITEAKKLLYYTDKSIKQISQELGFLDQSKFGRFFKNITGISPSLFRTFKDD